MAGSLWQQKLESAVAEHAVAEQLTSEAGYDYQPDCSSDGRWVVYVSYARDAVELWALNLETKRTRQLTMGGAVNLEPRFYPMANRSPSSPLHSRDTFTFSWGSSATAN